MICAIAFFLILFCVSIFRTGEKPFTREVIGEYLSRLAIPSAVCLAALLFAPIFECIFPQKKIKLRADRDVFCKVRREKKKLADRKINYLKDVSEARERFVLRTVCAALCTLSFVPAAVYVLLPASFSGENTSREVLRAAAIVFACALVSATVFFAFSFFDRKKSEALLKVLRSMSKKDTGVEPAKTARRFNFVLLIRLAVFLLGVALVVLGVMNGGNRDVLGKAINICYECIGLG